MSRREEGSPGERNYFFWSSFLASSAINFGLSSASMLSTMLERSGPADPLAEAAAAIAASRTKSFSSPPAVFDSPSWRSFHAGPDGDSGVLCGSAEAEFVSAATVELAIAAAGSAGTSAPDSGLPNGSGP